MATKQQRAKWKAEGKRLEARDAVVHAKERAEQRKIDRWYMLAGTVLIAVGVGLTIWSYTSASDSGGTYRIMYGPIVLGVLLLGKGVLSLRD